MKIRGKAPRNPLVVLVRQRKAGSHAPTTKVKRLREKQKLHKTLKRGQ
ncbi:MAG: hypothetical protein AB1591_04935 [Pseudomonadota bacterium]